MCVVFIGRAFSQDTRDYTRLSFVTSNTEMKFFDRDTGKLYIYSNKNGDFIKAWTLPEWGGDLIRFYPKKPGHLE